MTPTRILLVSGSLRDASINTAVLRTAVAVAPTNIEAVLYEEAAALPHFNPDDDIEPRHPAVMELRAAIHAAHAILFSPPEYAGALPGPFVNLLDWTIGDDQPGSIYEKPVGWVNASVRGASKAVESLRTILGFAHATVIDAACIDVPLTAADVGTDGLVHDHAVRDHLVTALTALGSAVPA